MPTQQRAVDVFGGGRTADEWFWVDHPAEVLSLSAGTRSMRVQPFQPRSCRIARSRSAAGADSTMVASSRSTNGSSTSSWGHLAGLHSANHQALHDVGDLDDPWIVGRPVECAADRL